MQGNIRTATPMDFDDIHDLDRAVIGNRQDRSDQISKAIEDMRCYVMSSNSNIQGFAIFSPKTFKGMDFLDLIVVDPISRRQGVASSLIEHFKKISATVECWTSTNQSNTAMISLLQKLGWQESGHLEELDPEDPDLFYFIHLV